MKVILNRIIDNLRRALPSSEDIDYENCDFTDYLIYFYSLYNFVGSSNLENCTRLFLIILHGYLFVQILYYIAYRTLIFVYYIDNQNYIFVVL